MFGSSFLSKIILLNVDYCVVMQQNHICGNDNGLNDNKLSVKKVNDVNDDQLTIVRHSTAHLLAQAVKELYPEAQLVIGPVIENGFFYDFYFSECEKKEQNDRIKLDVIEKKMIEIVKRKSAIERIDVSLDEAYTLFSKFGELFKLRLLDEIKENLVKENKNESENDKQHKVAIYKQGDFVDLCRGPHVANVGELKYFKLTKCSGAYWKGDSHNEVLQRIYGTAWLDKKSLDNYFNLLLEAEKRDHRNIGVKMDLFHFQPEATGMVFWHYNGWIIYKELKEYISKKVFDFGYKEISTPQMVVVSLWERSGHIEKFGENMFTTEMENRVYAIKPMNCPCHLQIFKHGIKSYKDLPVRYAEFGVCHRKECSGALYGLFRLRGFVQDDGHIFCMEHQIESEIENFVDQINSVYKEIGFSEIIVSLATRPEKRIGSDEIWDKSELILKKVLQKKYGNNWMLNEGDGAFYGPKLEFSLKDCFNRIWQCGTFQLDFSMPRKLNVFYVDEHGLKKEPILLHRAMFGSLERFIGIFLEHTSGNLPLWLAPTQAIVLTITDAQIEFSMSVIQRLRENGIRVNYDFRNEKIGFKIREASINKIPYILILGNEEIASKIISVRVKSMENDIVRYLDKIDFLLEDVPVLNGSDFFCCKFKVEKFIQLLKVRIGLKK